MRPTSGGEGPGLITGISGLYVGIGDTSTKSQYITFSQPPLNTWVHYAMCSNGSTFEFFIDGISQGTANTNGFGMSGTPDLALGARYSSGTAQGNIQIDEFLVTNNVLYTTNFTPPTLPYVLT